MCGLLLLYSFYFFVFVFVFISFGMHLLSLCLSLSSSWPLNISIYMFLFVVSFVVVNVIVRNIYYLIAFGSPTERIHTESRFSDLQLIHKHLLLLRWIWHIFFGNNYRIILVCGNICMQLYAFLSLFLHFFVVFFHLFVLLNMFSFQQSGLLTDPACLRIAHEHGVILTQ